MAKTSVSYKCPSCGAPLSFLPGHDDVTCEYCGTSFSVKAVEEMFEQQQKLAATAAQAAEEKWSTEEAGGEWSAEEAGALRVFTCSSCGAELTADENTMATECCYCGNPTMIPNRFAGMLKPDYIIPFKKTKEEAVAALKRFYEGKLLLPGSFKEGNRVEAIQPMYVPFWLFDATVIAKANFKAEIRRITETEHERIIETDVYTCDREGTMSFEHIPADGSGKMDDDYMDSIEPFDFSEMVPFSAAYLTGYLADKFDVEAEKVTDRADRRMKASAEEVLASTVVGYDSRSLTDSAIGKKSSKASYAMVPVWILTTRYQEQPYTFIMNGQTGKVVGSLPYDKTKAVLYPLIATILLLPVLYVIVHIVSES